MPHLVEIRNKYNESDVVILAFNVWERTKTKDDRIKLIQKYIETNKLNYSVILGENDTATDYGVKGVPSSVIITPDGKIAWKGHPKSDDFEKTIDKLVTEMKELKMKSINDSLDKGEAQFSVARGKGSFTSLSAAPEGFKWARTAGKTLEKDMGKGKSSKSIAEKDMKAYNEMLKGIVALGEKSAAKSDEESVYLYVRSKDGYVFMYTCAASDVSKELKELLEKLG